MMEIENTFNVSTTSWNGPLDLLLDLIQNSKIDIYDIPINEITHQYLETLLKMKHVNVNIASDFLIMASRLIYIKSKMLLPVEYQTDESDNPFIIDPRTDLINELLEYQLFKSASHIVENRQNHQEYIMERKDKQTTFTPYIAEQDLWQEVKFIDIIKIFYEIVEEVDKQPITLDTIRNETFSVNDKIDIIKKIFEEEEKINFYDLFSSKQMTKEEIIVTLWAILELYKQSFVVIKQHSLFADIYLFKREINTKKENL